MDLRAPAFLVSLFFAFVSGDTLEAAKHRPVSKVLTLLKDMVKQLEAEAVEDEKVFQEFGCWCETGLKSKTLDISTGEQAIVTLRTEIEEMASSVSRLNTEIGTLNKEVAANTEALEQATAMRGKELAEFSAEEKESLSTIGSLGGAIGSLSKHAGSAFLQVAASKAEFQTMEEEAALTTILRRHRHAVPEAQRSIVDAFLASPGSFLSSTAGRVALLQQGASSTHNPSYAPQSSAITGVLKSMKENFETNLKSSQSEETRSQGDYDGLKKAKTEEIAAGTSLADTKSVELADTEKRHAQSKSDLIDTERTLVADKAYLKNLKAKCATIDEEYEERTKTRQLEITATSKALEYLSSDDASDLFSRTFNPTSFLQLSARTRIPLGEQVRPGDGQPVDGGEEGPGLNQAEAAESQGSAIAQVEKSVGDMVEELESQKAEDDSLKDFCIDNLQSTERDLDEKHRERKNYEAAIADHEARIKKLVREMEELTAEIHASRVSLKRATEDREKMNKDFQKTVADQRATRSLLNGALSILKGFYDKSALIQAADEPPLIVVKPHPEPPLVFVQPALIEQPAGPPPPSGFKKAAPNSQSGGVMGMIEQIIKDADAMVEEALKGEEEAQIAYESLVGETNASIVAMQKSIVKKTEIKAQEESDKAQKNVELETVMTEIAELDKSLIDLHKQCDFHLKNYDLINEQRDVEIHSLKEAMALVAGQKYAQAQKTAAGVAP